MASDPKDEREVVVISPARSLGLPVALRESLVGKLWGE